MALTRERALQALQCANIEIPSSGISRAVMRRVFSEASQLGPEDRQAVLAEVATRTFLQSLTSRQPLYSEFEESVWLHFSEVKNLEREIEALFNPEQSFIAAQRGYNEFLRSMFEKSAKTRKDFYGDMLYEADIAMEADGISFGSVSAKFGRAAMESVHQEHLLVFYSVELLIRAYATARPRSSPISDDKLETFYRHFEAAFPLAGKFEAYANDDSLFIYSATHWMLPLIN